jgi:hypothetical protein
VHQPVTPEQIGVVTVDERGVRVRLKMLFG